MDSYRDFPSEFEPPSEVGEAQDTSVSASIGTDERRMHVRAYNYWVSLLEGRDYPSIEDLEPGDLVDFAPHSVLLDFTSGRDDPATAYIGASIRQECDLADDVKTIADVPSRSLLSRLTDHYMEIIANRAPVGFEAEFENQRGENICYRGILMPFSSDGDTIDFIYGVINWKTVGVSIEAAVAAQAPAVAQPAELTVDEEEPLELTEPAFAPPAPVATLAFVPEEESDDGDIPFDPGVADEVDADASLADRLCVARDSAEAVKAAEGRSREALYRALSRAYDFAVASKDDPDEFAELLEESGMKAQLRAPMTPIAKLVFGIDYNKARLTEYAAALAFADRQHVELGGFLGFIEAHAGGLKALVAAEREARRTPARPDTKTDKARQQLRSAHPLALVDIATDEEFALVLTRRAGGGGHEAVAIIDDPALIERAIRRAAA